jgi:hypothetical protein
VDGRAVPGVGRGRAALRVEQETRLGLVLSRLEREAYAEHARAPEGEEQVISDLSVTIEVDAPLRRH